MQSVKDLADIVSGEKANAKVPATDGKVATRPDDY